MFGLANILFKVLTVRNQHISIPLILVLLFHARNIPMKSLTVFVLHNYLFQQNVHV